MAAMAATGSNATTRHSALMTAFEGNSGPDMLTSSSALRDPERSYGGWPPGMLQRVHPLPAADERAHVTGQDRRLVKIHFARQRCHQQRDLRHLLGGHDVVGRPLA